MAMRERAQEIVDITIPVLVEVLCVTFAIGVAVVWAALLTGAA